MPPEFLRTLSMHSCLLWLPRNLKPAGDSYKNIWFSFLVLSPDLLFVSLIVLAQAAVTNLPESGWLINNRNLLLTVSGG